MILIDQYQFNSFKEKSNLLPFLSGFLPRDIFVAYNEKFNIRMDRGGHGHDRGFQYLEASLIESVAKQKNTKEVAFLFMADSAAGNTLSAAVVARDGNNDFIPDHIYKSTRKKGEIVKLDLEDVDRGVKNYRLRVLGREHYQETRDKGIVHVPEILLTWIKELEDYDKQKGRVRLYFGINDKYFNPEIQIVMLVDNKKEERGGRPFSDDKYAFDKGGGCCE